MKRISVVAVAILMSASATYPVAASEFTATGEYDAYGNRLIKGATEHSMGYGFSPDGGFVYHVENTRAVGTEIRRASIATDSNELVVAERPPEQYLGLKVGGRFKAYFYSEPRISPDGRFLAFRETLQWQTLRPGAWSPPTVKSRDDLDNFSASSSYKDEIYSHIIIFDLASRSRFDLSGAAKMKTSHGFFWRFDSASGFVNDCSSARWGCQPRIVRFKFQQRSASMVKTTDFQNVSQNGRYVLYRQRGSLSARSTDVRTGAVLGKINLKLNNAFVAVNLSADGTKLWSNPASLSGGQTRTLVIDIRTGKRLRSVTGPRPLAFSFDDTQAVVAAGGLVATMSTDGPGYSQLLACPQSQSANSSVWDKCWSSFKEPSMVATVTSCTITSDPYMAVVVLNLQLQDGRYRIGTFQSPWVERIPTPVKGMLNAVSNTTKVRFGSEVGTDGTKFIDIPWSVSLDGNDCK